jgi:hypothetical protein
MRVWSASGVSCPWIGWIAQSYQLARRAASAKNARVNIHLSSISRKRGSSRS